MPATPFISEVLRPGPSLPLGDGHGDEARLAAALHSHQDAVLVVSPRRVDGVANFAGGAHALAADFENHVTFLEAAFGCGALRIDFGDHDAFLAGAGHGIGGRGGPSAPWHARAAARPP